MIIEVKKFKKVDDIDSPLTLSIIVFSNNWHQRRFPSRQFNNQMAYSLAQMDQQEGYSKVPMFKFQCLMETIMASEV